MNDYQRRLERFRARKKKNVEKEIETQTEGVQKEIDAELQQLREQGKKLGIPRASQMGKEKLLAAIEEKEAKLANNIGDNIGEQYEDVTDGDQSE